MTPCAKDGCITMLTAYNPGTLCFTHAEAVYAPLLAWLRPQPWHAKAKCQKYGLDRRSPFDIEPFSRDRRDPLTSHAVRKAKALCATCPVREACLKDALTTEDGLTSHDRSVSGVWGGTLPSERRDAVRVHHGLPLDVRVGLLLDAMTTQARSRGLIPKEAV